MVYFQTIDLLIAPLPLELYWYVALLKNHDRRSPPQQSNRVQSLIAEIYQAKLGYLANLKLIAKANTLPSEVYLKWLLYVFTLYPFSS
jgi:hypothetical protein